MRRPRGNIILTALFVAIFLFFLSVALLWTNRQDVALSLSMEHKLRAQSAARSAATEAFAQLRINGRALLLGETHHPSGAVTRVQLVRVPASERHPSKLLVQARGTSGPVSSYYTLHCEESQLATPGADGDEDSRVLVALGAQSRAIYGDFKLSNFEIAHNQENFYAASEGPMYISEPANTSTEPFALVDYIPVFPVSGVAPLAYGPVVIAGPAPADDRNLSVLKLKGEEWVQEEIPHPDKLGEDDDTFQVGGASGSFEFEDMGADWTEMSLRTVGQDGQQWGWQNNEPPTRNKQDTVGLALGKSFTIDLDQADTEWASVPRKNPVSGYSLRGSIAAKGQQVYSHGWHYLYRQYDGFGQTLPVSEHLGNTLVRWPCILAYEGNEWSVAWQPLKEDGSVSEPVRPDPSVLLTPGNGVFYSVTEGTPRKLLTLSGKRKVEIGDEVPAGAALFLYQDSPYAVTPTGFLNLLDQSTIGLESLPVRIPEIFGMLVPYGDESNIIGLGEGFGNEQQAGAGAPVSADHTEMRTVRPRYDLTYTIASGIPAVDGKDIWCVVNVNITQAVTSFPLVSEPEYSDGSFTTLARFDGEFWHILPSGLRSLLRGHDVKFANSEQMLSLWYDGLPEKRPRYAVISVSTEAFEFNTP